MTEYDITAFVRDFADRTIANLDEINKISEIERAENKSASVYEVTQLLNSLLGLLIIPQQALKGPGINSESLCFHNPKTGWNLRDKIEDLQQKGRLYYSDGSNGGQKGNISREEFIRHLRNAVAHPDQGIWFYPVSAYRCNRGAGEGNFAPIGSARKQIVDIIFYDKSPEVSNREEEFCVQLSLEEVRCIAECVAISIGDYLADEAFTCNIGFKYRRDLEEKMELFKKTAPKKAK